MLRTVALRAQKHLTRRCALSLSPSLAHVVLPNAVGGRPLSSSASDASVKAVLGSAYLRSVASDVYALQNLFQSLASGSEVAQNLERCITRVLQCHDQQRRVFVTGMGKSGAVAQRLASTLSSISISSQWVHGGEWVHGELGGLKHGDVVIIISHSGRTSELLPLPDMFRKAGCCVMAIVGDGRSPLSKDCDLSIVAPAEDEANCPVPSRSIIVQLSNENYRVVRSNDPLLGRHSPRQRRMIAAQPVRPQAGGKPTDSLQSPRQKTPASPVNTTLAVSRPPTIVTSPVQCKSARANLTRLVIPDDVAKHLNGKSFQRPATSPVIRDGLANDLSPVKDVEPQFLFPINPRAREHVEIKACLLARTHRLDVDELQRIRGNNQLALNRYKMQRIISGGGPFSVDGSTHEEAKRKTTFLLRHFFTLQDSSPSPQDQLLHDVVNAWAIGDQATSDEISRLWKSINNHIEQSYLLRRKLVAKSDPDEISVVIAMDCLKKLPDRLPEYRRVLDVVIAVIESGLYLNNSADPSLPAIQDPAQDDIQFPHERRLLYFEAFRALQDSANSEQALQQPTTGRTSLKYWQDKSTDMSLRQRIEALFNQLENDGDKKELFGLLLRGNLSHLAELQKFALENIDSLLERAPVAAENKNPALFQRLVDRHPQEFAAILWQSPYLTAHIFQGSENLVVRVLEQNVYRISQVLTQRGDVLLPLLSHIFKENTAKPYILSDILQACHSTLTKVLAASPEIVSSAIKTNPQALPQIVREDSNILATVFATVPQCLGDTLEKHPEFFVDLAHRKPALEPLETNPALFTTFLVYHRSVLPDFNDPDFDPTVFKLKTTKKVEIGVQTSKNLNQGRRKLRTREKLRRECEELLEPLRAVAAKDIAVTATSTQTTDAKTEEELLNEEAVSIAEILNEIARLYVAKMAADEHDDSMNRKRQSLADFMMELYTLELGFKSQARRNSWIC
ncbi:Sugar isomerase (SIS) [Phytophthora cactorum]|nr:Sugar isomerase (SIS) [Phytophthora cactorum]